MFDELTAMALDELDTIWREFTTARKPKRGLTYVEPPEYDPERESILRVEPIRNGARVFTHQSHTGFELELIYTLVRRSNGWRLRDNRVYLEDDGSEEPWPL